MSTGLRVGRYELEERIGSGGQGDVWRAALVGEAGFRKVVALKRLRPETSGAFGDTLVNEALIGARLDHPNIVVVHELFRDDDELVLAMEYLDGEPLDRLIAAHPKGLPPALAVDIVAQVAAGLAYAHDLRDAAGRATPVVHRDLKPENVFVTRAGVAKILDFGIALGTTSPRTTAPGSTKGTVAFLAPELLDGEEASPASDVWALGAIAYEVVTGQPFVPDIPLLHAIARIQTADSGALAARVGDLVPALSALVRGALNVDPVHRPSAASLAASLKRPTLDPLDVAKLVSASTWTPSESRPTGERPRTSAHRAAPPAAAPRDSGAWWAPWLAAVGVVSGLMALSVVALALLGALWVGRPPGRPGGELVVAWPHQRGDLAIYGGAEDLGDTALDLVFDRLVTLDPDGGVDSRRVEEPVDLDGRTRLRLVPGLHFHPHPCFPGGAARDATADDLMASLELADQAEVLGFRWHSMVVEGDEVVLDLGGPMPVLTPLLALVRLVPAEVARGTCEDPHALIQPSGTGPWRFSGPVGPGAFDLLSVDERTAADHLQLVGIKSMEEAVAGTARGEVDVARLASTEWVVSRMPLVLRDDVVLPEGVHIVTSSAGARSDCVRGLLTFREGPHALTRREERWALSMALNRDALDDLPVNARFVAGRRILGGSQVGYDAGLELLPEDPVAARAAWAERTDAARVGAYPSDGPLARAMVEQAAAAGIPLEVVELGEPSLGATLEQPRIDAFLGLLCLPPWGNEPLHLLPGLMRDVGRMSFGPADAEAMQEALRHAPDLASRDAVYRRMEAAMLDEMGFTAVRVHVD